LAFEIPHPLRISNDLLWGGHGYFLELPITIRGGGAGGYTGSLLRYGKGQAIFLPQNLISFLCRIWAPKTQAQAQAVKPHCQQRSKESNNSNNSNSKLAFHRVIFIRMSKK